MVDIAPCAFFGHGSPMNIIAKNEYTQTLKSFGQKIKNQITSILCISAHWQTEGVFVTGSQQYKTIYDFSGFPESLYQVQYNAPGLPSLAKSVSLCLKDYHAEIHPTRGLDHGTWSVLVHLFPEADIPVVQLSCNLNFKTSEHYEMGKLLRSFREQGVFIMGSGNIVHSFYEYDEDEKYPAPVWAIEFDAMMKECLLKKDHLSIQRYRRLYGKNAKLSVPTEDHFVPLLYPLALQSDKETTKFIYEGFQNGAMSMRSFAFGESLIGV